MPAVIPEDFGQSATEFRVIGTDVFGLVILGHSFGAGVPTTTDGANAIMDSWQGADIMSRLASTWQVSQVELTIMSATGPLTGSSTRTPLNGTGGGNGNSPNGAILVRKNTATGGRPGRGRMYVPGFDELQVDSGGNLLSGDQAAFQSVMDDLITDLTLNDVSMVLLHSNPAISPSDVQNLSVQTRTATQRRRLRR